MSKCIVNYKGLFRAAVPSGASTGVHEALELRDTNAKAYMRKALLSKQIPVTDQAAIDKLMIDLDGTENKEKLGQMLFWVYLWLCAKQGQLKLVYHFTGILRNWLAIQM
ncbi:unnamed protein product [Heterobilharzia americana]|nr:unnamed protein product [Heterobilharzia americana]